MAERRAVVIGGGLGGLAAAAALHQRGWKPVVVERDAVDDFDLTRRGLPQAAQLHNLLGRAQSELDGLLPGFTDALVDAGAGRARVAEDTHLFEFGIEMPRRDLGLQVVCAPRTTIDRVARDLLQQAYGTTVVDRTKVTGLMVEGGVVAGVRARGPHRDEVIRAPLVVDASGHGSAAPRWLQELGFGAPPSEQRAVHQWYVSARYGRAPEEVGLDRAWMVFPSTGSDRGALVSPLGADRWFVSVSGRDPQPPPTSSEEMLAHARSLPDPAVAHVLDRSNPLEPPSVFRRAASTWCRYERLERPLPGLVAVGDSVAALNPIYGQGMSVAAWQASDLGVALEAHGEIADLTADHHRRAAQRVDAAWRLAELAEGPPQAFLDVLTPDAPSVAGLSTMIAADPAAHRRYVAMWHLLEPVGPLARRPLTTRSP